MKNFLIDRAITRTMKENTYSEKEINTTIKKYSTMKKLFRVYENNKVQTPDYIVDQLHLNLSRILWSEK